MKEKFEQTIQQYGLGYPFEIEQTAPEIVTIKIPATVGRRLLMQLVGTCDNLKLHCYLDARGDQLFFVAYKA